MKFRNYRLTYPTRYSFTATTKAYDGFRSRQIIELMPSFYLSSTSLNLRFGHEEHRFVCCAHWWLLTADKLLFIRLRHGRSFSIAGSCNLNILLHDFYFLSVWQWLNQFKKSPIPSGVTFFIERVLWWSVWARKLLKCRISISTKKVTKILSNYNSNRKITMI